MIPENENQNPDNNANNSIPNNNQPAAPKEDAMSILEKRLAEINARKGGVPASETPAAAPVNISSENASAERPDPTENTRPVQTEANALPVAKPTSRPEPFVSASPTAINIETKPESEVIALPETMPQSEAENTPQVSSEPFPDADNMPDSGTVASGAIAAHEVIPPAEQSKISDSGTPLLSNDAPSFTSGNNEEISTFSTANPTVSETGTSTQTEDLLETESTTGHILAGAIAAHEIMPEVKPLADESETKSVFESVAAPTETVSENAVNYEIPTEEEVLDTDYAAMSAPDLERQLMNVLKQPENRKNYRQVNAMYREYELKLATEKNEAQDKFITEGGTADDFKYRISPERQALEKAMQGFRENRVRDQRSEEEQKVKNLQRKQQLITELREVVEAAETKSSADKMKAIQEEWKAIGPVPQNESQQLWNSYHALLDIFYNNRSIYFELKELDRKRNLNTKQQLVERAEALANNPSINASLQELRHLHEEWKNIGPVPNEQRDQIWERFIQASEKVHERKKEFLNSRREVETANLTKKTEVLQRLEAFQNYNTDRINDWRDKTDEIQKIKEEWDAIGLVPKENADQINKRFWSIYKAFFHNKNQFFKALDEQKMQNLKLKTELCEQAEAVKDSTDWDATKEQLIQLQKKWKTIGRVPDKYSDKIWERFRAACNEFFDRKQTEAQQKEVELDKLSEEKNTYLDDLTEQIAQHTHPQAGTMEHLQEMVAKWKSLDSDSVRVNARAEEKFYALMEKYLDTVPELSNEAKNDVLFKLQLNKLKGGPDASTKLHQKEQSIRKEIGQLENDIRTLKTNIEFFAKSKNAEKLREEYDARIAEANKRIEMLQKQLKEIRS